MSVNICDLCYEMTGEACYSALFIETGLTPATDYTVWIEDHNERLYTQAVTTDSGGDITLDLSAFDEGMFNAFSGYYIITVSTSDTSQTIEELTVQGQAYQCIKVTFHDIN